MKSESPHVDSDKETRANFFRQSGWMMAANMVGGVFMAGAQFLLPNLTPGSDFSVAVTIFRIFVLVSLPAAAAQTLLAQQTAAAITEAAQKDVAATSRSVLRWTFLGWLALTVIVMAFQNEVAGFLQASNQGLVLGTMLLILGAAWWPLLLGLLQGRQMFFPFGWSTILNGLSRFATIAIGVKVFQIGATGATWGAFAGFAVAIFVAAWPARVVLRPGGGKADLTGFVKKTGLLMAAACTTTFMINVDMPLVLGHFPKEIAQFYAGAETIGIAVVILCVPVAAVMFPKIVRGRATATTSNALNLALTGTMLIAGATALFCTFFPDIPLRILYFKRPEMVQAAPLIRWFMWAMVPVTIYNVLVNNLIARERYAIVPWAAILPIGYAVTLYLFLERTHLPPFATFQRVIQILLFFSTTLMLISIYYSRHDLSPAASSLGGDGDHSQPTGARPS
jgi:O-antigen/teichoic acid export membrane protein